jgi:hypothetical protein
MNAKFPQINKVGCSKSLLYKETIMKMRELVIATLGLLLTTGWAVAAENEGVVYYTVNLDELPGAQVYEQIGARTADGRCTFTDGGTGQASGHGRVLVITEVSFDPKTCVRELARAEYAREALPASVAAKVELPASSDTTQRDSQQILTPTGPAMEETQAPATVQYLGSLKVNVEDPPQIDVTTTKSSLRWSNTGSHLNTSYHDAHWGWYSPSGWRRTNAHWSYDNNGSRAYTDTYGKYRNGSFCATIDTWTEHRKTYFEGRPYGGWSWSYNVQKWGGCSGLLHYEYIVETP